MARPVSWIPRLYEIRQSVAQSVRSHYGRRDIERLFELQPRAAQKLLEMLPAVEVGTARLVDREVLTGFLDKVRDAENTTELLQQIRQKKPEVKRQKLRSLVRRDAEWATVGSLPSCIQLSRGRMSVEFATVEQLAEAMYRLAKVLQDDSEAFADAFEPACEIVSHTVEQDECETLFAELKTLETKPNQDYRSLS